MKFRQESTISASFDMGLKGKMDFRSSVGPEFEVTMAPFLRGPPGTPGNAANTYEHTQSAASAIWTINHNLGSRPLIMLYSIGWVEVEAEIVHLDANTAQALFVSPVTGFAICK